jgi:hypothetical protein
MVTMKPREHREKVVLPAKMRAGAGQVDICIRNISSRGMLLQAAAPPVRGTYVEIIRPACTVAAKVVWTKDRRFGVQLGERVSLDLVLDRRHGVRQPGADGPPLAQVSRGKRFSSAALAHRAELSRQFSAAVQRGFLGLGAVAAAVGVAGLLHSSLTAAVAQVTANLN